MAVASVSTPASGDGRRPAGQPWPGHDFVHVAVDDYSRYAYAEALPDEPGDTTAAFLERVFATFQALGAHVERILTDNGGNRRSYAVAAVAVTHGVRLKRTRP